MKLSILIPVYNESASIEILLRRVAAVALAVADPAVPTPSGNSDEGADGPSQAPMEREIIVVNDSSTDGTREILTRLESEPLPDLRVVHHQRNQGKGAAVRTALAASTGDYVIIQDADLEYDPADYPRLLAPILTGQAQLTYGVRSFAGQKLLLHWGNSFLTWVTNLLFGARLHDMETCYKLLPGDLFRTLDLECNRFDMEPEITAKVLRRGYHIHEVPISYEPRGAKKLSPWRDGFPALWALIKYRWQRL